MQCGFRKGFNADLSKAFDCLHDELLITKLDAYIKSVKLIQQYLSNRKQRVKAGNAYSSWNQIFYESDRDQSLVRLFSTSSFVTYFISSKASQ